MFLTINQKTMEVTQHDVRDISAIPGATNNGQHYQLEGYILAEVRTPANEVLLYHPQTKTSTGHIDVTYRPRRLDRKWGVDIQMYSYSLPLEFRDDHRFKHTWPDGQWHLLETIIAIEEFLKSAIGYEPTLKDFIARTFHQTPPKVIDERGDFSRELPVVTTKSPRAAFR